VCASVCLLVAALCASVSPVCAVCIVSVVCVCGYVTALLRACHCLLLSLWYSCLLRAVVIDVVLIYSVYVLYCGNVFVCVL
jgi:hypothetical protein